MGVTVILQVYVTLMGSKHRVKLNEIIWLDVVTLKYNKLWPNATIPLGLITKVGSLETQTLRYEYLYTGLGYRKGRIGGRLGEVISHRKYNVSD